MRTVLRGKPLEARFWALVNRRGPDECWPWMGRLDKDGYGRIQSGDSGERGAHQIALELGLGRRLEVGEVVRHRCDNRWCVNSAHLLAGSVAENNRDMRERGRHRRGDQCSQARLTESQVVAIRERYAAGEVAVRLAIEFGVSDRLIGLIARGEKWPHAGGPRSSSRRPGRREPRLRVVPTSPSDAAERGGAA